MKKVNALVLGLVVLLAFSCGKKEKNDDPTPANTEGTVQTQKTCKVTNHHTFDYNSDFAYLYNAAGQLINVARTSPTASLTFSDSIKYDSNGNISTITRHSVSPNTI